MVDALSQYLTIEYAGLAVGAWVVLKANYVKSLYHRANNWRKRFIREVEGEG